MGKLGRLACIFTPMALSLASLICLLVVFLAGTNKNDGNLRSLYFFKADASNFSPNAAGVQDLLKNAPEDTRNLVNGLIGSVAAKNLKDVYYVYLWNHCTGTKSGTNGSDITIDFCSDRKAQYYFNPIQEWGLNNTIVQQKIPGAVDKALSAYQKGTQWMFIAYAVAFFTTIAAIVVGAFAICSRVGSCVTAIVSAASTLFAVLAAVTSSVLFSTLVGGLNGVLKPYRIELSVGSKMLTLDWIAAAFSITASLFWFISICCCSGKSGRKEKGPQPISMYGNTGFGANRGYQPLGEEGNRSSQYGANRGGHEMQEFGNTGAGPYKGRETAYEPFRQV